MNVLRSRYLDLLLASTILVALSFLPLRGVQAETQDAGLARNGVTLTLQPTVLAFGDVSVGNHSTLVVIATNAGSTPVTVLSAEISAYRYLYSAVVPGAPVLLQPGASTKVQVTFAPLQAGQFSSTVIIGTHGQNEKFNAYFSAPLTGTGTPPGQLTANPSSLSFGNVQVGGHDSLSETLTNASSTTVTVSQANLSGAGFQISGLTLPLTLTSQSSYTFQVIFSPTTTGPATGTLSIISNASDSNLPIPLTGARVGGTLTPNPTSLNFGNVNIGSNQTLNATLTAGASGVTVTSMSVSSSEFTIVGISLPLTISAGQSAPLQVTFTPQSAGAASASAVFVSNATNSPTTISLTGTGVADPPPSVTLTWDPSQSQVVGYNVYRGGKFGGPYSKQNSTLDSQTSYVDNGVKDGSTYYYVTTAVNSAGEESAYSNQVQAVVPLQ